MINTGTQEYTVTWIVTEILKWHFLIYAEMHVLLFQNFCHNGPGHWQHKSEYSPESNKAESNTSLFAHYQCVIWGKYHFIETVL